jgi:hypothetical protein
MDAINMINAVYDESLGLSFIIPKMKKGFVGDQVEPIEVPHDCINMTFLDELETLEGSLGDGVSPTYGDDASGSISESIKE